MNAIVTKAEACAGEVAGAKFGGTFDHAVEHFITLLGTVPDCGPRQLAAADIDRLRDLAEGVIQLIELRLELHDDRRSIQRNLASGVYRIRRVLEQIDLWRRHYQV